MRPKSEILEELQQMLHDVLILRATGASYSRLARAQGCVDGYMRALLESGECSKKELLDLVAAERAYVSGPSTRVVTELEETLELAAAERAYALAARDDAEAESRAIVAA